VRATCPRCNERVPADALRQHTLDDCKAAAKGMVYLKHGLRPFPATHTLPAWLVAVAEDMTRVPYEGEPREWRTLLPAAEKQFWMPRWVDVLVELWSPSLYVRGDAAWLQRNAVLFIVFTDGPGSARAKRIVDAYAEGLSAVRTLVAPLVVGPLPLLRGDAQAERHG
jgi:hypothetical protein